MKENRSLLLVIKIIVCFNFVARTYTPYKPTKNTKQTNNDK